MQSIKTGSAIAGIGIGLTTVGLAGLAFFKSATSAAVDYNQQAALTLTQVDQVGVSLETIKNIGRDVAAAIPAPFEQMQSSLYDIFSSMDVNVQQAQTLLTAFSEGAVAGQTDVQTAGRATIAIMNAFKVPIEDVNQVMDMQFETVKKGVITYDQLATTIGRAIPSAEKAGQTVQELGGAIAFATRNGLSASMAATSVARAFDMLSNPKFAKAMHDFGIEVYDASGKLRPLNEVMDDLRNKMQGMTPEQVNAKLAELTKGAGGTIQAMRFLNLALGDTSGMFDSLVSDIGGAQGSMQTAYDIMFNQPASQAQLFKNNLDILKTEIGDTFLPVLNKILPVMTSILQWFQNMDPHTRTLVVTISAVTFALMTLTGIIMIAVGGFMIMSGVLTLMGSSMGTLVGNIVKANIIAVGFAMAIWGIVYAFQALQNNNVVGAIIGITAAFVGLMVVLSQLEVLFPVIAGVAAILGIPLEAAAAVIALVVIAVLALAYVVYRNWDTIKSATADAWDYVVSKLSDAWGYMQQFWGWVETTSENIWGHLKDIVSDTWNVIVTVVQTGADVLSTIWGGIETGLSAVGGFFEAMWGVVQKVYGWFASTFGPGLSRILTSVGRFFSTAFHEGEKAVQSLWSRLMWFWSGFTTVFIPIWDLFTSIVKTSWDAVVADTTNALSLIWGVITTVIGPLVSLFGDNFRMIVDTIKTAWDVVVSATKMVWDVIKNVVQVQVGIIVAFIENFGGVITSIIKAAWDFISNIISTTINIITDVVKIGLDLISGDWGGAWDAIKQVFIDAWNGIWDSLQTVWGLIKTFFIDMPGAILGFLADVGHLLWQKGVDLMNGLWDGLKETFQNLLDWVMDIPGRIKEMLGDFAHALLDVGRKLMGGLLDGIKEGWNDVTGYLSDLNPANYKGPPARDAVMMFGAGRLLMGGLQAGMQTGWNDTTNWLSNLDPTGSINTNVSMAPQDSGRPMASSMVGGGATTFAPVSIAPTIVFQGPTDQATVDYATAQFEGIMQRAARTVARARGNG
jgi:TP901 family phage tail tape measure protein